MKRKSARTKKDQKLLNGLRRKDNKSLHQIYDLYFSMVERMVLRNSGNKEAAEDLFQEALIVLYRQAQSKDFALSAQLKTYLYAICKRLWLKKLRFQKRHPMVSFESDKDLSDVKETIEEYEEEEVHIHQLNEALNNLGSPCKELLEGFYLEGYSMKELAKQFHYTNASNAKTQKYKCLQRLKKIFFKKNAKKKKEDL